MLERDQDKSIARFYLLANKLDGVIKNYKNNIYVISNPIIHLSRNHPEYLSAWSALIYQTKPQKKDIFNLLRSLLFSTATNIKIFFQEFALNRNENSTSLASLSQIEYMFISHFLGDKIQDLDFYYGDIVSNLAKKNRNVVRLLIPQVDSGDVLPSSSLFTNIFLNNRLSKKDLLKYALANIRAFFTLIYYGINNRFSLYEILTIIYGQMSNFSNVKIATNLNLILSQSKPGKVVMTFEGNAIERSIFHICYKNKVTSIGYQHAPIIKDQYSIFRELDDSLDPDIIWTTGSYVTNKFIDKIGTSKQIINLGSPKFDLYRHKNILDKNRNRVLLIPDGNEKSIIDFFNLGVMLISSVSGLKITIRAHPLFKSHLEKRFIELGNNVISNFNISTSSVSKDLEMAYWVIYQNSSICIQALFAHCEVIHLAHPLANIDPLYELEDLHFVVDDFIQIKNLLWCKPRDNSNIKILRENFAKSYFSEINLDLL